LTNYYIHAIIVEYIQEQQLTASIGPAPSPGMGKGVGQGHVALPDGERAERLAALRSGQIELTEDERLALEAAKIMVQEGTKPIVRGVYRQLEGRIGLHRARASSSLHSRRLTPL
jgi:hypothetical protein